MAIGAKECTKCGKFYKIDMFPQTNSRFFIGKRADMCFNCIETMIDSENYDDVNKVCQWLDYPLLMGEWMKLYKVHRSKTFRMYSEMFFNGAFDGGIDWTEMNEHLKAAIGDGTLIDEIPEFNAEWMNQMAEKWQMEATSDEYKHLEFLHADLLRTQNIITGAQADAAKKMCKLSLMADKEIRKGIVPDKLLKAYNDLGKASDFTPKNAKNAGDFDSVGEVFLWLEKRGWNRNFYDFVEKDQVDTTMNNVQAYLRRLVLGESNLAEEVEKRLAAIKNFDLDDAEDFGFDQQAKEEAEALMAMDGEEEDEEFEV